MDFLVHHMLQRSATRSPDREALVHGDERLTYAEVARRATGLAEGLKQAGVERGEVVARQRGCRRLGISEDDEELQGLEPFQYPGQGAKPRRRRDEALQAAVVCDVRDLLGKQERI